MAVVVVVVADEVVAEVVVAVGRTGRMPRPGDCGVALRWNAVTCAWSERTRAFSSSTSWLAVVGDSVVEVAAAVEGARAVGAAMLAITAGNDVAILLEELDASARRWSVRAGRLRGASLASPSMLSTAQSKNNL